jgi:LmbE family N-acetylglucosaminyl deacetylase
MKIIIFAPHPDDECHGAGGAILKWLKEGHDIHVIWLTDGRAAYREPRKRNDIIEDTDRKVSEVELARLRTEEANLVAEFLGIKKENRHFLCFKDQELKDHIDNAIEKIQEIVKNSDIFVIPSAHDTHPDHEAAYQIAVKAADIFNLHNINFYVYALYSILKSEKNQLFINKLGDLRFKVYNAVKLYKSLNCIKSNELETLTLKNKRKERFGIYKLQDKGKYYNF